MGALADLGEPRERDAREPGHADVEPSIREDPDREAVDDGGIDRAYSLPGPGGERGLDHGGQLVEVRDLAAERREDWIVGHVSHA